MPPSDLQRKLRALRGHLRRLLLLTGASRVVLVIVGVLAASLFLDWAAKLETPGRVVLLGGSCGLALYALWRYLVAPLRVRLGDDELALVVERRFPDLHDRLISTVQFARRQRVEPLSQAMVDRLVQDTVSETYPLDFGTVATAKPAAVWALGAAATVIAASLYTLLFPATAAIFATRFFDPFSSVEWPRRTQLSVLAYDKDSRPLPFESTRDGPKLFVPKGEDLHLVVRAARHSGRIWKPPRRVTVRYRFEAGGSGRRHVPMGDHASYHTAFPTVTESFAFDVSGDDASTRTYRVQIRNRPRIEDIRVTIRAPAYTGERERVQADGRGSIAGLSGSVATVEVTASKPIAPAPGSARLLVDGQAVADMSFVEDDPRRLRGEFTLRAGQKQYAIALIDTVGLTNSPAATYRLDVRPDRAPAVQLPEPGGSKKVTPKAVVPIRGVADDDYGIVRYRFVFRRGEKGEPTVIPFPDPEQPEKKVERSHEWDLTALALRERETLLVYAEAEDAYAETRDGKTLGPNVGKSPTYHLTVISEAEMASLLQRRQQEIKERLKKLIARQEDSKAEVDRLAASKDARDHRKLKLAEREQTKIAATTQSLGEQLGDVLQEMENNKVGNLEERRRADALSKALDKLAKDDMPAAARQIASAVQTSKPLEQTQRLGDASARQQQILDDLRAALARFDQWQDIDELIRDASDLLLDQKKLAEQATELARELLGKPAEQLTPEEKGAARSLGRAQRAARDRMQALETKMAEVASKLQQRDPAAAKLVEQALSQATADQIRPRMDDAATQIENARPASALPHQAKATEGLERLVESLNRARSPYLAKDIRELQKRIEEQMANVGKLLERERRHLLETGIANLRRSLGQLRQQQASTQAATSKANSAQGLQQQAPAQDKHTESAEDLGRQLERLTRDAPKDAKEPLDKAGEALKSAASQMKQAAGSLAKASPANAQQAKAQAGKAQAGAMHSLEQADRKLADLQKQLAQGKPEADRLPQRAEEQGKTADDTKEAARSIAQDAKSAEKTVPATAKSVEQAGRHAEQASESMSKAQQSLQQAAQQRSQSGAQQQSAQNQQHDAVDDLDRAREQLARAHEELDLRRRVQKLFELQRALTELLPKQVAIREATQDLDRASEGGRKPFDHAQTLELRDLADDQGALRKDAAVIIQELEREQVPVFLYVMRDADKLMGAVQQRLTDQKTDWMTQEAERDIERNIADLLEALKSEASRLAQQQQRPQGGGGGGGGPQPLVAPLHQLKQLKALQLRVNEQTRAVEVERLAGGRLRERLLRAKAKRLAEKQREISGLSRKFGEALEKRKEEAQMTPQ